MKVAVLSGGGAKGAWQIGVLKTLAEAGETYDGFTGVSVGALNGSFLAQYPKKSFWQGVKDLEIIWNTISTKDVHRGWKVFGPLASLWKPSVRDSKPLWGLVVQMLDPEDLQRSGVLLRVGAVNLESGEYQVFKGTDPEIRKAVLASSSFPVMLTPVTFNGVPGLWTDGGVRTTTPLKAAIDMGATHVDILMTFPEGPQFKFHRNWTVPEVAMRTIHLMMAEVIANDIKVLRATNDLVRAGKAAPGKRVVTYRVFRPEEPLTHNSLDFSQPNVSRMKKLGYAQALPPVDAFSTA